MNIVVPVKDSNSIEFLINSGADEFYCGVLFDNWIKKYGNSIEYNRRGNYGKHANFQTMQDFTKAVRISTRHHKRISLTANALKIDTAQAELLTPLFSEFKQAGGQSVIISDINLIRPVKDLGLNVTISSCATVNNIYTAQFYESMGVDRIILPRNITLKDMEQIVHYCPNMEFEMFIMNDPCRFVDGNCLGIHHTGYGSFCRFLDDLNKQYIYFFKKSVFSEKELKQNEKDYKMFFERACGICALYDLIKNNIFAIKLAGRLNSATLISNQIIQIKNYIETAENSTSKEEFLKRVHAGQDGTCSHNFTCYYKT